MKLVPLGDRVVLKQLVAEETTKSELFFPDRIKRSPSRQKSLQLAPAEWWTAKK